MRHIPVVKKLNNLNYKLRPLQGLLTNVLENNSSNEFARVKFARLLVGENGQIKIGQITTVPTTNVHVAPVKPPKTDPSIYCCFSANRPRRFSASHTNGGNGRFNCSSKSDFDPVYCYTI